MSLAVVLVADDAVALAADSVYVEVTQDGAVVPASLRRKVFGVGDYAGALTGVATYEGHDFTVDLADALQSASGINDALAKFVHAGQSETGHLHRAYDAWRGVVGPDEPPASFMQIVVAGRDRLGGPVRCAGMALGPSRRFEPRSLAPEAGRAYCGLYGSFDSEARRWASGYDAEHRLLSLQRSTAALPPGPRSVDASLIRPELETLARRIVSDAITREEVVSRPSWWPLGQPVLSGPVESVAI